MRNRLHFGIIALTFAVLLCGCGGGGSHAAPAPLAPSSPSAGTSGGPITATFSVQLPTAAQVSEHTRGVQYVSSATQMIFLFVQAPTSSTYTYLNSATCSATACTIAQGFDPGTYSIALALRDSTGQTTYSDGHLIATIAPDTANAFSTTFYGSVAAIAVAATQTQIPTGVRTTIPLNLALFDAAGNQIIGAGALPLLDRVQLSVSDTSGATTIVPAVITGADLIANRLPALLYSGGVPSSSTVSVSVTNTNILTQIAGTNVAPTSTALAFTFTGSAPAFTSSAVAGVSPFQQSGTIFENFLAATSHTGIAVVTSAARPDTVATPSATYPNGGMIIGFNAGSAPFAQHRTLALDRRSPAMAAPANGFKPDSVFMVDRSHVRPSGALPVVRARTQSLPALGATRSWNIDVAPISGGALTNSSVAMTLVAVSAHGYIWLDNALLGNVPVSSSTAAQLGQMFDAVYTADTTIFGPTDYNISSSGNGTYATCSATGTALAGSDTFFVADSTPGMINVLLPRDSSIGSGEGGYFNALDLESQDVANCNNATATTPEVSNQASTIVIAANSTSVSSLAEPNYLRSSMAHELQHLIHFVNHEILIGGTDDPSWIDEGMAMIAEDVTTTSGIDVAGTPYTASAFLSAPYNFSLTGFSGLDAGSTMYAKNCAGCYGQSYLFVRYLVDRFGIGILKTLTQTGTSAAPNVVGATGVDFTTLVNDFDTALALDGTGIVATAPGTRYALTVPIGGTYRAGSDESNATATYPPLTFINVSAPNGGTSLNAILGAPVFFKISGLGAAVAVKITDLSNGSLILDPTLIQQ